MTRMSGSGVELHLYPQCRIGRTLVTFVGSGDRTEFDNKGIELRLIWTGFPLAHFFLHTYIYQRLH